MSAESVVYMLVEKEFEDLEVWYPKLRLSEAGISIVTVGTGTASVYAGRHGLTVKVDALPNEVDISQAVMLLIPGGWAPDRLRRYDEMLDLVRKFDEANLTIGVCCRGAWVLASAGILAGRTLTGFYAIRADIENAGATFVDQEVVRDRNLVSSRTPADLPAFMRELLAGLT